MRETIFVFCLVTCLTLVGCARSTPRSSASSSTLVSSNQPRQDIKERAEVVIKTDAKLTRRSSSDWRVTEIRTSGREHLRSVYFLDGSHGWVGGKESLYRTDDGGTTWRPVKLELAPKAFVSEVIFLDPNNGWIVTQEETEPNTMQEYQDNRFRLMRTIDGGQTWRLEMDEPHSVFERLRFNSTGEGWLVGRTYVTSNRTDSRNFILHTTNLGAQWLDVAEPLNDLMSKTTLGGPLMDIMPGVSSTASVLSSVGSVFDTTDGGKHWRQMTGIVDDDICACQFGVIEGKNLWVGGPMIGRIIRGMVATREGGSWREYVLEFVSFDDIMFFSRSRILSAGSTTPNQTAETDKREAVISYSSDGGRTWAFIYHNVKVARINVLAAIDSDHVWAVGDDGVILRLTATTKMD